MTRDVAIRLDALLMGARGTLDMIVAYMKGNLTDAEYEAQLPHLALSMTELIDVSNALHALYPDIVPDELKSGP